MTTSVKYKEFLAKNNQDSTGSALDGLTDQLNTWIEKDEPNSIINIETVYTSQAGTDKVPHPGEKYAMLLRVWYRN